MTRPNYPSSQQAADRYDPRYTDPAKAEEVRQVLRHLDEAIRHADEALGISAADLPELTEEDHDRLALERINHRRSR